MAERPNELSLEEFYLLAQSYPAGSKEFDEVFDIAVRMFPNDPVANLNAANAAMASGHLDSARHVSGPERHRRSKGSKTRQNTGYIHKPMNDRASQIQSNHINNNN